MKKVKACIILIIIATLGIANCGRIEEWQREQQFKEPNFTKEELLEYIETHETTLSPSDFADVDDDIIEGFITYHSLSIQREWVLSDLKRHYDNYLERLDNDNFYVIMSPYYVRKLRNEESTEEEYHDFIQRFFKEIEIEAEFLREQNDGIRVYAYRPAYGEFVLFNFCQTNNTRKLVLHRARSPSHSHHYKIEIGGGGCSEVYSQPFYYSKNGKYLAFFEGNRAGFDSLYEITESFINLVRIFSELDD
jgi:hypothetical protein